jgi:molybdopterin synthase sulfur carrier subunit
MRITVKLYADLRKYTDGEGTIVLELAEESSVMNVMEYLKIPEKETKIIMVNGRRVTPDTDVNDDDRVAIFPPIAGG